MNPLNPSLQRTASPSAELERVERSMGDDTLRRKLILQHAGELVLSAVGSGLFCYPVWRALSEVSKYGYVTLNAGSRFGSGVIP